MFQSNGVIVKSPTVIWSGPPSAWGNSWPATLQLGHRWASYSEIYRRQHWVRTCVDKRASLLSRLPLKVYEHDDQNRPEARGHPYAVLLNRPNIRHGRVFFWAWMESTYDIFGETFAGKIRDAGGRPVQLVPLHPSSMREVGERDGRVLWDFDNGKVRISNIPDEDLLHLRTYNPDSFTRGLSKLESLRSTLENEDAALRSQSSFWRRGARPGVALSHPGQLSKPAADRLKLQWDAIAAGADNTGTTVVLEEGMKPEVMQISASEAQYIDGRKLNREEVVAGYDMPPPAVHILDHATFSNITEQLRSVYRDTMAPICVGHESELEVQLRGAVRPGASEPDFGDDVYAEWLLDGVLRGDFEQRADAYQKAINSGWTTPAEVRKLENLPFIEGSDKLYINSTMVPLDGAFANPLGALVRAGFEPDASTASMGIPPIAHTGLVPVTVQGEDAAVALPPGQVRSLMGRLSRYKALDEIDTDALVAGLNGSTQTVLDALNESRIAGEDVAGLRARLQRLGA